VAGSRAFLGPTERGPVIDQREDRFEPRRRAVGGTDGLLEELEPRLPAADQSEHAKVADHHPGHANPPGTVELLPSELLGAILVSERELGDRGGRPPADRSRIGYPKLG